MCDWLWVLEEARGIGSLWSMNYKWLSATWHGARASERTIQTLNLWAISTAPQIIFWLKYFLALQGTSPLAWFCQPQQCVGSGQRTRTSDSQTAGSQPQPLLCTCSSPQPWFLASCSQGNRQAPGQDQVKLKEVSPRAEGHRKVLCNGWRKWLSGDPH